MIFNAEINIIEGTISELDFRSAERCVDIAARIVESFIRVRVYSEVVQVVFYQISGTKAEKISDKIKYHEIIRHVYGLLVGEHANLLESGTDEKADEVLNFILNLSFRLI